MSHLIAHVGKRCTGLNKQTPEGVSQVMKANLPQSSCLLYILLKNAVRAYLGIEGQEERLAEGVARKHYAKAQTWKKQLGSFGHRFRLNEDDRWLRSSGDQARDDHGHSRSGRTRRHILRYGSSLRPVRE